MPHANQKLGLLSVSLHTILWGFYPLMVRQTFAQITPLQSLTITTLLSAILYGGFITWFREWPKIPHACLDRSLLLYSFLIGVLFYGLFYWGLRTTAPGSAALLGNAEVLCTIVMLSALRGSERLHPQAIVGALLLLIGIGLVLWPSVERFSLGAFLILFATIFPPVANLIGKDARRTYSAHTILFVRSIVSGVFLLLFATALDGLPSLHALRVSLPNLLILGFFVLGLSKIFWIESIYRMKVATAISLGALAPVLTLLFGQFFYREPITHLQFLSLPLVIVGVHLLVRKLERV